LPDDWQRYLRQQIELGGSEVVLSASWGQCAGIGSHSERSEESGSGTSYSNLEETLNGPITRAPREDSRVRIEKPPARTPHNG
jgi:hypothetical protein